MTPTERDLLEALRAITSFPKQGRGKLDPAGRGYDVALASVQDIARSAITKAEDRGSSGAESAAAADPIKAVKP